MTERLSKELASLAVASVTTGRMLCDGHLAPIQEAIEWFVGHPVWTHEIPRYMPAATEEALRQFPDMPREMDRTKGGLERTISAVQERFGPNVTAAQGNGVRTMSPIETLTEIAGVKPVIVVVPEKEE